VGGGGGPLKLCRFDADRLGVVEDDCIRDVSPVLDLLPVPRWGAPAGDVLVAHLDLLRPAIDAALVGAPRIALDQVRLLSPVASPGKVVAVRRNYRVDGEGDSGSAELFLKASSSVAGPADGIALRFPGRRVDHEVELVAVVGRTIDRASPGEACAAVAGYCIGIDVTLRGTEDRGLRKSLDGYTLLGPWLTTADEASGVADAGITLAVNGRLRQQGRTSQMARGVAELLASASEYFALRPGDVVLTGTPAGVGPLAPGDRIECAITGLGSMQVAVR